MSAQEKARGGTPRGQALLGFFPPEEGGDVDLRPALRRLGVSPGDTVLAAVSGGADSLALLCLLQSALAGSGSRIVAAHLDHGVREARSGEDAEAVARLCSRRGVPLAVGRLSAGEVAHAKRRAGSLEGGLRELRYRFLADEARRHGARWVVTGHQRDDQAETVLFRCLRGMDWRSLSGIPEERGSFLRPLLGQSRASLARVCSREGETPLDDATNRDTAHARNHIRHDVLPALRQSFHPDATGLLCRMAAAAEAMRRWERGSLLGFGVPFQAIREEGVPVESLRRLPAVLLPGALLEMAKAGGLYRTPGRKALASLVGMAGEGGDCEVALPGGVARIENGRMRVLPTVLSRDGVSSHLPHWFNDVQCERRELTPCVQVLISTAAYDGKGFPSGTEQVLLARSALRLPLQVRTRRSGDRFEPLGLGHGKSLKEFLIDRKVPRAQRTTLPLVVDGSGRIAWVVGVEVAHWARLIPGKPCEALLLTAVRRPAP